MIDRSSKIARCAPLLGSQNNIARRWLGRAQGFDDPFVRFFFSFSGFNALYFAWAKADDLRNRKGAEAGEGLQIKNLLQELSSEEVERKLEQSSPAS